MAMENKTVLIAGGSGLVGRRLSTILQEQGYSVKWLSRRAGQEGRIRIFEWNPARESMDLAALNGVHAIICLAGAGIVDKAWTTAYKKVLIESRTQSAFTILKVLKTQPHQVECLLHASASGYYGNRPGESITEDSSAGTGFLADTTVAWEKAFENSPVRTAGFRIGIVLTREGGALPVMARPLGFGICPILGSGKQGMSWVHIDDLCGMFIDALENSKYRGVYNAVAPNPVSHREFMYALRKVIAPFSIPVPAPAFAIRLMMGERASVVLEGVMAKPRRTLLEGYSFRYTDLEIALRQLYGK